MDEQGLERLGPLGGTVLDLSLVREQDVRDPQGELLRKPGQDRDVRGYEPLAEDDVAKQAPLGSVREAATAPGELAHLAYVVEDGPEEQQVAIDGVEIGRASCRERA